MFYKNNIEWNHLLKLVQQWTHSQLMLPIGQQAYQEKGNVNHGEMITSYLIWIMVHLDQDAIIVMFVGLQQHPQVL